MSGVCRWRRRNLRILSMDIISGGIYMTIYRGVHLHPKTSSEKGRGSRHLISTIEVTMGSLPVFATANLCFKSSRLLLFINCHIYSLFASDVLVNGAGATLMTNVTGRIAVITGFLPRMSPGAQVEDEGGFINTINSIFVGCKKKFIQGNYMESELMQKYTKHKQISFNDASIKAAKASKWFDFMTSLSHPATKEFLTVILYGGYNYFVCLEEGGGPQRSKPTRPSYQGKGGIQN